MKKPKDPSKPKNPNIPKDGRFTSEYQPENKGVKPKYDYDADEFYDEIFTLAFQGMVDAEIADALEDKLGFSLSPDRFGCMKAGKYECWTPEENERRGSRMRRVLERARRKTNSIVRGRYLKMALGGIKTKNVTTVKRRLRINGILTDDEDIQTTTSEIESAPNLQALSMWLHHHDPEWRKKEGIVAEDYDDDPNVVNTNPVKGIDISAWIDQETRDKEKRAEQELTDINTIDELEEKGQ